MTHTHFQLDEFNVFKASSLRTLKTPRATQAQAQEYIC